MGRTWSLEEYEQLRAKGYVPGRSSRAIQRAKLRLKLREKANFRRPWTEEEVQRLRELHAAGYSARKIVREQLLPFTLDAIQKRLCRLGLAKTQKIFKFTPRQREELKKFLQEHWLGKTPQDLTDMWNAKYSWLKIDKRRVVSYLRMLGIKIPYSEVIRINGQRRREAKLLASFQGKDRAAPVVLEAVRMSRVKMLAKRFSKGRDLWSGMPLGIGEYQETQNDSNLEHADAELPQEAV